ncbi:MAG: hypothetical protein Q8M29_19030 [Bacteroidota bacterium]|nr:hypothetical protein [Bacteroidota bacterium]
MKQIFSIILFFFCIGTFAQSAITAVAQGEEINVLYRNEATGGIFAHSRGFGAEYKRLKHVTGKKKRFMEVQLLNMKHPKEFKVRYEGVGGSKSFYYGKLNSLFMLRGGIGFQRTLYERSERKSVEIRMSTSFGPNLTFAKPVYLYVFKENLTSPVIEKYDPELHTLTNIAGRAPSLYGFGNMRIYPGAYGKMGFSFEYADYSNEVKALEAGVVVDAFPVPVPTMANVKREQVFVTLYLGIVFGKKWF